MGYYKVVTKDGKIYPALVVKTSEDEEVFPFEDPCATVEEALKIVDAFNHDTEAIEI